MGVELSFVPVGLRRGCRQPSLQLLYLRILRRGLAPNGAGVLASVCVPLEGGAVRGGLRDGLRQGVRGGLRPGLEPSVRRESAGRSAVGGSIACSGWAGAVGGVAFGTLLVVS
jgi:hypothetical protein